MQRGGGGLLLGVGGRPRSRKNGGEFLLGEVGGWVGGGRVLAWRGVHGVVQGVHALGLPGLNRRKALVVCVRVCVCVCVYVCTTEYTHTHTHIYIYIHIYI